MGVVADLLDLAPEAVGVGLRIESGLQRISRNDLVGRGPGDSMSLFVEGRICHTFFRSGRMILTSGAPSTTASTRCDSPRTATSNRSSFENERIAR